MLRAILAIIIILITVRMTWYVIGGK